MVGQDSEGRHFPITQFDGALEQKGDNAIATLIGGLPRCDEATGTALAVNDHVTKVGATTDTALTHECLDQPLP